MSELLSEQQRLRAFVDDAIRTRQERLPAEPALSALLDIPRGRLRTHLKRLEKDGLIWRHVGKGTFVGQRTAQLDPSALSSSVSPSDVMDARLTVEPLIAGKAAIYARQAEIEVMERALDEMREAKSFVTWKGGDDRLHRAVATATQNPLMLILYDIAQGYARSLMTERLELALGKKPGPIENSNAEHEAIVRAIKAHDPDGAEAGMRKHLLSIRAILFGNR